MMMYTIFHIIFHVTDFFALSVPLRLEFDVYNIF